MHSNYQNGMTTASIFVIFCTINVDIIKVIEYGIGILCKKMTELLPAQTIQVKTRYHWSTFLYRDDRVLNNL